MADPVLFVLILGVVLSGAVALFCAIMLTIDYVKGKRQHAKTEVSQAPQV